MKKVNLLLRYSGFFVFFVGIILNVKIYIFNEWPTYLFFGLSLLGILLVGISYLNRKNNKNQKKVNSLS